MAANSWNVQLGGTSNLALFLEFLRNQFEFADDRSLTGGFSGAAVVSIDIQQVLSPELRSAASPLKGHYILKITSSDRVRRDLPYHRSAEQAPELAGYVSRIAAEIPGPPELGLTAVLYEVATGGLLESTTLEHLLTENVTHATRVMDLLCRILLRWGTSGSLEMLKADELIRRGLGWRLGGPDVDTSETVQACLDRLLPGQPPYFLSEVLDRRLANPIRFVHGGNSRRTAVLLGPAHADLHAANVIVRRPPVAQGAEPILQIIDFTERPSANALFDLAYLELSLMMSLFENFSTKQSVLEWWRLERYRVYGEGPHLGPQGTVAERLTQPIWDALTDGAKRHNRQDAFRVSFHAAGVEAGLNYARKLVRAPHQQHVALLFAASRGEWLAKQLDEKPLADGPIANLPWPSVGAGVFLAPAPRPPRLRGEAIVPAFDLFRQAIEDSGACLRPLDQLSPAEIAVTRIPKFLLFERSGIVSLAVAPGEKEEVNTRMLQRSGEPRSRTRLLAADQVAKLGFKSGHVHPVFTDPDNAIHRVIWDAAFLAQAILFPESLIVLPWEDNNGVSQVVAPCGVMIDILARRMHSVEGDWSEKTLFANIVDYGAQRRGRSGQHKKKRRDESGLWTDEIFQNLLWTRRIKTRFAPTPSNRLHLGNARTALATYLFYRQHYPNSAFHLRIDDTDHTRSQPGNVDLIKKDLSWLGINSERYEVFWQGNIHRWSKVYEVFRRLLDKAGMIVTTEDAIVLPSQPGSAYYNIWIDYRKGVRIEHTPPLRVPDRFKKKKSKLTGRGEGATLDGRVAETPEPKSLSLVRQRGGNPYYRYAGLIDDLLPFGDLLPEQAESAGNPPITFVFRDHRQAGLTRDQAHIRYSLEQARQQLAGDEKATEMFGSIGLNPLRSLPLPIYVHLPVLTDKDGKPLSKSAAQEGYMVGHLIEEQKILPEAVVAYLLWTLIPQRRPEDGMRPLKAISRFVGAHGIECALASFAQGLELSDLTRGRPRIRCLLHHLEKASRWVLEALSPWALRRRLQDELQEEEVDHDLISSIHDHRQGCFADWRQVLTTVAGPRQPGTLAPATREYLTRLLATSHGSRAASAAKDVTAQLRREIEARRQNLKEETVAPTLRREASADLAVFLGDLRKSLTGSATSPKIERLIDILGPSRVLQRLDKAASWEVV